MSVKDRLIWVLAERLHDAHQAWERDTFGSNTESEWWNLTEKRREPYLRAAETLWDDQRWRK